MINQNNLQAALQEWQNLLPGKVLQAEEASHNYGLNTTGVERKISGAILPSNVAEVQHIVHIAQKYRIALYPLSTGRNWGYGGATPVRDDCVIVDLSRMNQIIAMDKQLGLITIEPGVTQGQLKQYLDANNLPFIVPVTGAGPNCSLMGNALERGYGLNPNTDHFSAVTTIEAVMPNGELYRTPLTEAGGDKIDKAFKWGIGPYIDGLFSQGNMGIVTAMTIALSPKPEYQTVMLFHIDSDQNLIDFISILRETLCSVGMNMGSVKLTNLHRLVNIIGNSSHVNKTTLLTIDDEFDFQLKRKGVPAWLSSSLIYGNPKVVSAVKQVIKNKLKKHVKKLQFLNSDADNVLKPFMALCEGSPNETALHFTYSKSGIKSAINLLNPDRDGCGLIWFAPLIPMQKEQVQIYLETVKKILIEHQIEPVLTFSSLSNYCLDSTIPILFNKNKPEEIERASACYLALFTACKEKGFLPYRMPIHFMDLIIQQDDPYWKVVSMIKKIIDPENIIAPGRYST